MVTLGLVQDHATPPAEAPLRRFLADFADSRIALAGLVVIVAIAILAVAAPLLVPQDPYNLAKLDLLDGRLPPGSQSMA
jgi:peptide/nickel transport system permease protein